MIDHSILKHRPEEDFSVGHRRFVDLSIAIEADLPSDPPFMVPKIQYIDHAAGAQQMTEFFPGMRIDQLPRGLGWAVEVLTLTTHSGTHLDAPHHYHPFMDRTARGSGNR